MNASISSFSFSLFFSLKRCQEYERAVVLGSTLERVSTEQCLDRMERRWRVYHLLCIWTVSKMLCCWVELSCWWHLSTLLKVKVYSFLTSSANATTYQNCNSVLIWFPLNFWKSYTTLKSIMLYQLMAKSGPRRQSFKIHLSFYSTWDRYMNLIFNVTFDGRNSYVYEKKYVTFSMNLPQCTGPVNWP